MDEAPAVGLTPRLLSRVTGCHLVSGGSSHPDVFGETSSESCSSTSSPQYRRRQSLESDDNNKGERTHTHTHSHFCHTFSFHSTFHLDVWISLSELCGLLLMQGGCVSRNITFTKQINYFYVIYVILFKTINVRV